jgi:uncharacterized protein (UPF0332 family)
MNGRDFLLVAYDLLDGLREADWRSAASRAYYAAFHAARDFMLAAGFSTPLAERAHAYLWHRLANSGHPDIVALGNTMSQFRGFRNSADYDTGHPLRLATAVHMVHAIDELIKRFDDLNSIPEIRARVIDAMKTYEKDVLREVSWKTP